MMSAALSDSEISSAGSPILNTRVKPSELHPCEQKRGKGGRGVSTLPIGQPESAQISTGKYSRQKMTC